MPSSLPNPPVLLFLGNFEFATQDLSLHQFTPTIYCICPVNIWCTKMQYLALVWNEFHLPMFCSVFQLIYGPLYWSMFLGVDPSSLFAIYNSTNFVSLTNLLIRPATFSSKSTTNNKDPYTNHSGTPLLRDIQWEK